MLLCVKLNKWNILSALMSTYIISDYDIFTYDRQLLVLRNYKYLLHRYDYNLRMLICVKLNKWNILSALVSTYTINDYDIFTYDRQLPALHNHKYLLHNYNHLKWQRWEFATPSINIFENVALVPLSWYIRY